MSFQKLNRFISIPNRSPRYSHFQFYGSWSLDYTIWYRSPIPDLDIYIYIHIRVYIYIYVHIYIYPYSTSIFTSSITMFPGHNWHVYPFSSIFPGEFSRSSLVPKGIMPFATMRSATKGSTYLRREKRSLKVIGQHIYPLKSVGGVLNMGDTQLWLMMVNAIHMGYQWLMMVTLW